MAGLRIRFDPGEYQQAQREREEARAAKTKAKSDLAAQTRGLDIQQQAADTGAGRLKETIDARKATANAESLLKFTAVNATDLEIGALRTPDDIEFVKWLGRRVNRMQKYNEKYNTTLGQGASEALTLAEQGKVGEAREIMKNAARVAAESGEKSPGHINISGADREKLGLGLTDDQQEAKAKTAKRDHDMRMAEASSAATAATGRRAEAKVLRDERQLAISEAAEGREVAEAEGIEQAATQKRLATRSNTREQLRVADKALNYLDKKSGDPIIGPLGYAKNLSWLAGTDAYEFEQLLLPLKSEEFLKNVQELRGMGQLSNIEGDKLQSLITSLDQSDPAMMEENIKTIVATLKATEKRADRGITISADGTLTNREGEQVDDEYNVIKQLSRADKIKKLKKLRGD